jgi:hypothetical protein
LSAIFFLPIKRKKWRTQIYHTNIIVSTLDGNADLACHVRVWSLLGCAAVDYITSDPQWKVLKNEHTILYRRNTVQNMYSTNILNSLANKFLKYRSFFGYHCRVEHMIPLQPFGYRTNDAFRFCKHCDIIKPCIEGSVKTKHLCFAQYESCARQLICYASTFLAIFCFRNSLSCGCSFNICIFMRWYDGYEFIVAIVMSMSSLTLSCKALHIICVNMTCTQRSYTESEHF